MTLEEKLQIFHNLLELYNFSPEFIGYIYSRDHSLKLFLVETPKEILNYLRDLCIEYMIKK